MVGEEELSFEHVAAVFVRSGGNAIRSYWNNLSGD